MSLVAPDTRWWNRSAIRRIGARVCWIVAVGGAFLGSWSLFAGGDALMPFTLGMVGVFAAIPLIVLGMFLFLLSTNDEAFEPRSIFTPLAAYFVANGAGGAIGQHQLDGKLPVLSIIFVLAGLAAIGLVEVFRRRSRSDQQLRSAVERDGAETTGHVTRARSYSIDYRQVTRVTVKFIDAAGRELWTSQSVPGVLTVGAQVRVRYSPSELGRRAAMAISRL